MSPLSKQPRPAPSKVWTLVQVFALLGVPSGIPIAGAKEPSACAAEKRVLVEKLGVFLARAERERSLEEASRDLRAYVASFAGKPCGAAVETSYAILSLVALRQSEVAVRRAIDFAAADRIRPLSEAAAAAGESGRYRCERSEIELDFGLDPLNLGAVFLHELGHFERDKLFASPATGRIEAVVADEVLAALDSAWSQFRFVYESNRRSARKVPGRLRAFRVHPELKFSAERGAIFRLYRSRIRSERSLGFGVRHWPWFHEILPASNDGRGIRRAFPEISRVIREVGEVYFPGAELNEDEVLGYVAQALWRDRPLEPNFVESAYFGTLRASRPLPSHREVSADPAKWLKILELPARFRESGTDFKAWTDFLDRPSAACRLEIERATKEGSRPTKEGSRPTKEGSRPTKEGSRPCVRLRERL